MNETHLRKLLSSLQDGTVELEQVLNQLQRLPIEAVNRHQLDHHRSLRTGIPEVIFGQNKSSQQLVEIIKRMLEQPTVVLATRVSAEKAAQVRQHCPQLRYHPEAGMLTANDRHIPGDQGRGTVVITTAGSSDLPVAEEARLTLHYLGHQVACIHDAGVAGIHRILSRVNTLQEATVVIVIAGMEGALPSVVAGITAAPVIGVPTSVGYGTGAGGYSALLGMLNSCSPGLAVVNIDNGFGAACMAAAINRSR
ncbi:nickel pincer cofactor biosynthesis protein LarB [Desulfogranum mediterraneum]|uniref:nickel pincer cofactor biosynthesis protein LarB n=1 Tax=Desulfogranum mediterraneum TaxID=160661 RepID=UPI0003FA74CD|nr:nickel pincer cofactor biosynthesis protein LarB [Desulfogranum mediterraneum]